MGIVLAFAPFVVFALIDRAMRSIAGAAIVAIVLALVGAIKFTGWLSEQASARHREP